MGFQRCLQLTGPALTLAISQRRRPLEALRCRVCQCGNGATEFQALRFGLARQRHKDFALPAARAPKTTHEPLEGVVERAGVGLQRGRWRGAGRCDGRDEVEDFF